MELLFNTAASCEIYVWGFVMKVDTARAFL